MIAEALPEVRESPALTVVASRSRPLKPLTLPHFRAWSRDLILDTGLPFALEPFQALLVADILARAKDGTPLYSEIWDILPEGNGKTTLIAIVCLYVAEFRPFAAIKVGASSRDQANILYGQAEGIVLRTPRLYELVTSPIQLAKGKRKTEVPRFQCLEGYRRINHFAGGRIQIYAADENTGDGVIPDLCIIDEPHRQANLGLYRTWSGKLSKRNGQIVAISTRGEPRTDFEQTLERIKRQATRSSTRSAFTRYEGPGIVLHEWALAVDADPADFRAVKAANPFSGISIRSLRAKHARPTMTLHHWLRFVCNRPTRAASAGVAEADWKARAAPEPIPEGVPVWLGLDVAWKWDTTSAVPLWERDPHYRQLGEALICVPPRDGSSLDSHEVERGLLRIHRRNPVHTVVMDMSRAEQLAQWIRETLGAEVIDRSQSNGAAAHDYERFTAGLRSGELWHSGDPELTGHVMNAVVKILPLGDGRFDRPNDGRDSPDQERRVIDALTAAAMANSAAVDHVPDPPRSPRFIEL